MTLNGKNALILGVANERSIAWEITKKLKKNGANVALSFLNDALKKRVEPLSQEVKADFIFELDVTNSDHLSSLHSTISSKWEKVDILIHSLAFADREDLKKPFIETSKKGFMNAIEISAFSFVDVANRLKELFVEDSSLITMTYHGSTQVIPGYNVMGVAKATLEASMRYLAYDLGKKKIRVNAISAGPIRTLAASGISGFKDKLKHAAEKSFLGENVSQEDVAKTALYLSSNLSSGVTGEVMYVDAGLSKLGI